MNTFDVNSVTKKNLFSLGSNGFFRSGAYFGIFVRPQRFASPMKLDQWGTAELYLGSRRGGIGHLNSPYLMQFVPMHHGEIIAFSVSVTATELTVNTSYGQIRFCFPKPNLMLIKGENGLSLQMGRNMVLHQMCRRRGQKAWETAYGYVCSIVYEPVVGEIDMKADWKFEDLGTPAVNGQIIPDADGNFLVAVEEFLAFGCERDSYPTYEEGLAEVTADWEAFLAKQPDLGDEYAEMREQAAYMTWANIVEGAGLMKRPYMFMRSSDPASSWQMVQNAVVLKNNLPLAIEFMLNMIDRQSPDGQLADWFSDQKGCWQMIKPPIQGWGLEILMKEHDLKKEVPMDKLVTLYEGYSRWADWLLKYRDQDGDGILTYEHGDETGNDDSPLFKKTLYVDAPEFNAIAALLFDVLGDFAKVVDRPEDTEGWKKKAQELIDKMVGKFWNGDRFVAYDHETGEVIDIDSLHFYRPLILGKRLPAEIIDKLAADLAVEGRYQSIAGLTTMDMSKAPFAEVGTGIGKILPADNILIITGLYNAGKKELAKKLAKVYCDGLKKVPTHFYAGGFIGSWAAAAFQILANVAVNG